RGSSTRSSIDQKPTSNEPRVTNYEQRATRSADMTISELLLPEFDQEMASTRRVLERVPEEKFAWKPHAKSFSMGDLASHIANMLGWAVDTMEKTEFDLSTVTPEEMNRAAASRAQLLEWF